MAVERDEYEFIARFRADALLAARQAEEALRGMGDAADDTAEQMDDANRAIGAAEQAAAKLATFVASALASFAIINGSLRAFADFEVSMLAIAKVSDLTAAELDDLGKSFESMAAAAGLPIEDFLKVGEVAGQLGIEGSENIREFTRAMVDLGGASNITAEEGANAIARMLNVTQEGIEGARTIASVLVELGNISAATEREIVDRAQEVALATAAFGMNTTDALALGAVMSELGLRAETSGTAVGRVFIAMSEAVVGGGEALTKFAAATGMTEQEFRAMQASDPTGLFYRLIETLSDKGQNEIIRTLSGLNILNAENAKTLVPLITGYERVREVRERAFAEAANPDALDKEAARAAEALAREFEGLMQMIQSEVRQLGELLAPVAQALIDLGKAGLEAFNGLPEIIQNVILLTAALAPVFIAGAIAVNGLVLAMGFMLPAGLRAAAAAGAVAGAMTGMGAAGIAAGGALGVLRYAIGTLFGPIGIAVAVIGTLAFALSDSGEQVSTLETELATAQTAMDEFAAASERAAQEQIGLRNGITESTEALLAQSRAALQTSRDNLELARAGFRGEEIEGIFSDSVAGELDAITRKIEEIYEAADPMTGGTTPFMDIVAAVGGIIRDLDEGRISADAARDSLNNYLGLGSEAIELVSRYRNVAAANPSMEQGVFADPEAYKEAATALIEYAKQMGLFGDELAHVQRMAESGDYAALALAMADLAREVEYAGEAGEELRGILSPALLEAIANAADAEVRIAAIEQALLGNHEAAELILETGNPFAHIEEGARAALAEVDELNGAMDPGIYSTYREYAQSRIAGDMIATTNALSAARALIADYEGFRNAAYPDMSINAQGERYNSGWRAGYGSDTGTRADGSTYRIQEGMTISEADARRDLDRRVRGYFDTIVDQIGPSIFSGLSSAQKASLASLLHNYGEGEFRQGGDLSDVLNALREGTSQQVADAIAALGTHNGGINMDRRRQEAQAFGGPSQFMTDQLRAEQDAQRESTRLMEEQEEARARLLGTQEESIAAAEFELSLIGKSVAEQARLRAEFDLLNQAKRDGIDVDAERTDSGRTYREEIEATARAMGELAAQEERQRATAERAAKATEFYNEQQEAFQQGVLDAILEGENLVDVLGSIAKAFARAALEAALFGSGPFGGGGGGLLGGIFGKLFGGITGFLASAEGNVFSVQGDGNAVRVRAYARGGLPSLADYGDTIVRKPTAFNMGPDTVGLMGEAGDEAIIPLRGGKVRAIIDGEEFLIPLERAGDGHLGVRVPSGMLGYPGAEGRRQVQAYAFGGVPGGVFADAESSPAAVMLGGPADRSAPGALAIDYRPTYNVTIAEGAATVTGGTEKGTSGKDQQRMIETMDAVIRAKMIEFLTDQMRNGGMLNPAAKPYG